MTHVARVAAAVVCLVCGCAGAEAGPRGVRAPRSADGSERAAVRQHRDRPADGAETDRPQAASIELPVSNTPEVERQIRVLEQAIALYEQFIERAAGQPEMKEAVQRSRERIEDARETIRFLLGETSSASE